jgi:conjugative transposon TraN protein
MKKNKNILLLAIILGTCLNGICQSRNDTLDITFLKTTSLIFDYPIINVDRGSRDVLAQKVREVDNTLQIKAARRSFPETNLTVITADGKLHHFYVCYSEEPQTQTFKIDSTDVEIKFKERLNVKEFQRKSDRILRGRKHSAVENVSKYKIKFSLNGIYIDDDVIFYQVQIKNKSNINYDIQSLRFFIRDKQKLKRTASQEDELFPLYVKDKISKINGRASASIVYALQKFTIPNAETLDIELFEKNGGRNLRLRIDNQAIVKAEWLP